MILEQIPITGDRNFAYLVADEETRQAALVDPGADAFVLVEHVRRLGLTLEYVFNTHGHSDHTAASAAVCRLTGARLAAFARGDVPLSDGDSLTVGRLSLQVIHTPGHTPDSICLLVEGNLITGDTLFVGKVGGTDDETSALTEHDSLRRKLCSLPPATIVWPGHDYGVRPSSSIGCELKENPFLLQETFEDFFALKNNWAEYKRVHGIK
jgi:hydroxyacylglutathione hydrolase